MKIKTTSPLKAKRIKIRHRRACRQLPCRPAGGSRRATGAEVHAPGVSPLGPSNSGRLGRLLCCIRSGPFWLRLTLALAARASKLCSNCPQNWDELGRGVKTDKTDAHWRWCCGWIGCWQGNTKALAVIRVPTEAEEQARSASWRRRGTTAPATASTPGSPRAQSAALLWLPGSRPVVIPAKLARGQKSAGRSVASLHRPPCMAHRDGQ